MKLIGSFHLVIITSVTFLLSLSSQLQALPADEPFSLDERIERAVLNRNYAFSALLPDSTGLAITAWDKNLRKRIASTLQKNQINSNVWQMFIAGILSHLSGNNNYSSYLKNALNLAKDSPGTTWLLFYEFERYRLQSWAESSLMQLEKQLFIAGGRYSSVISRQLLHLGNIYKKNKDINQAKFYYTWAHRFDSRETASLQEQLTLGTPLDVSVIPSVAGEYFTTLKSSWFAQLQLLYTLYNIFSKCLFLFIIFTVATLCIKHFSQALHGISHLYPDSVPLWFKNLLIAAILLSTISFGLLPFIWLVAFLIWKYCEKHEKILLGIVLGLIIVSPFATQLKCRLQNALNPTGVIGQLSEALEEAYPVFNETTSDAQTAHENDDLPRQLTLTYQALKHNDIAMAEQLITPLSALYPNDPVVITTYGVVLFLKGAIQSAKDQFQAVVDSDPSDYIALFNLARCYLISNNASEGMKLIEQAARINDKEINHFIQNNDFYFINTWPPLRQLILPTYSPARFWKSLFMPYSADKESYRLNWGLSFFGFSPIISFFVFCLLLIILLTIDKNYQRNKKLRRQFECKYCGRTICRKCTTGVLCDSCSSKTKYIKGTQTIESVRKHISDIFSYSKSIRNTVYLLLLPGFGNLLQKSPKIATTIPVLILTTIVYTIWFALIKESTFKWMQPFEIALLFVLPAIFHIVFIIKYLPQLFSHINNIIMFFSQRKDSN